MIRPLDLSPRLTTWLGVAGALAVLVAAVLPWTWARISGSDSLVEIAVDEPLFGVAYLVGAAAAVGTGLLLVFGSPRRLLLVGSAVTGVALVVALLAVPLPTGSALGASVPGGQMYEIDIPTHRSVGWYLTLLGTTLVVGAGLICSRRRPGPPT